MSKKTIKIIDSKDPLPSTSSDVRTVATTDWTLCIICQCLKDESLQCPADSSKRPIGAGYQTFEENLNQLKDLQDLPKLFEPERLDDGNGISNTLLANRAKWHKSCLARFSGEKVKRAKRKKLSEDEEKGNSKKHTRLSSDSTKKNVSCLFCEDSTEPLHEAATFRIDSKVRQCALELQDTTLLAKLSEGDLVAIEAKYHAKCLAHLYYRASVCRKETDSPSDNFSHGLVLAELLTYIEDQRADSETIPVFKLADLVERYLTRLKTISEDSEEVTGRLHSTRLKDRILEHFPDMIAAKDGKHILLSFNEDLGPIMRNACRPDDDDAIILAKAAKIVRKQMFNHEEKFNGKFDNGCQQNSVPKSLTALVNMILYSPNIDNQSSPENAQQPAATISQLLQFNSLKRQRKNVAHVHHRQERETPLPVYVGLMLYGKTRKRELVDTMFELGLSVCYDRVLAITTDIANKSSQQYEQTGVVCPKNLRKSIFTTAAIDNIDHNTSSSTSNDSFHGTGISLFQSPEHADDGEPQFDNRECQTPIQRQKLQSLPNFYTDIPWRSLPKTPKISQSTNSAATDERHIQDAKTGQTEWLEHVKEQLRLDETNSDKISWAAYHASSQQQQVTPSISAMLPLFAENSKSPAMIAHAIDIVKKAVAYLNPGQPAVVTVDQPLYAVAKCIQWTWPLEYGQDKVVLILGGLHIEMTMLKLLGDVLDESGWSEALVKAGIAQTGTADSFIKGSHVVKSRHAHQVTACALYILMCNAYSAYKDLNAETGTSMNFEDWNKERNAKHPQHLFWYTVLQLQLLLLCLVESFRAQNFGLYQDCLSKIAGWCFSLDHINYARWLCVHLSDMMDLQTSAGAVQQAFVEGKFTVNKTGKKFSNIAIDQAHEQNNAWVKGDGGVVGLLMNEQALERWMTAGPEVARLISDFQTTMPSLGHDIRHHDQTQAVQATFMRQVNSLVSTIEEMGNPFIEESTDLLHLDSKNLASSNAITSLRQIEAIGTKQFEEFMSERLQSQTKHVLDPIKKNKFTIFAGPVAAVPSINQKVASLKNDCALFSRLFIACQTRDGNLEDFFKHENQPYPPSLSQNGDLRLGSKSDLLDCLSASTNAPDAPEYQSMVIDGAALVNMIKPSSNQTFSEYAHTIFIPYVVKQLEKVDRLDLIWDTYSQESLKASTRQRRGKGIRRRVEANSKTPNNWQQFLRLDDNKTELFTFLAKELMTIDSPKQLITTMNNDILSLHSHNKENIAPCNHPEADSRLLLHVSDAASAGFSDICVRTVDTDVVVIATSSFQQLNITTLWIAFGTGRNFRYLPIHDIVRAISPAKARALPLFHSFTGSDTSSSFCGIGKKRAWEAWRIFPQVTTVLEALIDSPSMPTDEQLSVIEHFVVIMYDKTSQTTDIHECRKSLFAVRNRMIENIPPTRAALLEHLKRAIYQASFIWCQALKPTIIVPSPAVWGWQKQDKWVPYWTSLPEACKASRELIRCSCTKGCRGLCKCSRALLKCTALCKCGGDCT